MDAISGALNGARFAEVSSLDYDAYGDTGVNWRVREGYGRLIARLGEAGVTAVKIEGRQRGKAYVARVTRAFRMAIDALDRGEGTAPYEHMLTDLAEGGRETQGAYNKRWR